jgi:iron-sulfur cluster repair protein YtfE (RIC family)
MGESFDSDVAASGIRAAVTGFKRAYKQFRFPSVGMTQHSHKEDTILGPMLYKELATAIGECILSTLYSDPDRSPWE